MSKECIKCKGSGKVSYMRNQKVPMLSTRYGRKNCPECRGTGFVSGSIVKDVIKEVSKPIKELKKSAYNLNLDWTKDMDEEFINRISGKAKKK